MVRPYEDGDLEWLMDTADRAWRPINEAYRKAYGEELFPVLVPNPTTRKGEEMRALCREDPGSVFVCVEGGRRVGFIHISMDTKRKVGIIGDNPADPGSGLKGIGQQMYRFALERFREAGMAYAKVTTGLDEGHAPARRAYERAGFNISRSDIHYFMKLAPEA